MLAVFVAQTGFALGGGAQRELTASRQSTAT
ncbi:MAG: hypothetical protein RL701_5639 [Pseudomonadota bacterium]